MCDTQHTPDLRSARRHLSHVQRRGEASRLGQALTGPVAPLPQQEDSHSYSPVEGGVSLFHIQAWPTGGW